MDRRVAGKREEGRKGRRDGWRGRQTDGRTHLHRPVGRKPLEKEEANVMSQEKTPTSHQVSPVSQNSQSRPLRTYRQTHSRQVYRAGGQPGSFLSQLCFLP